MGSPTTASSQARGLTEDFNLVAESAYTAFISKPLPEPLFSFLRDAAAPLKRENALGFKREKFLVKNNMAHRGHHVEARAGRAALYKERLQQVNALKALTRRSGYKKLAAKIRSDRDAAVMSQRLGKLVSDAKGAYAVGMEASGKVAGWIAKAHSEYQAQHRASEIGALEAPMGRSEFTKKLGTKYMAAHLAKTAVPRATSRGHALFY